MGFGYNPGLMKFGERLDMLDFFVWMRSLQEEFGSGLYVYDASSYYIVNRTPKENILKLGERPSAEAILEVLVNEQDRPKRKEIMLNSELRSEYLQRLIEISGVDARYIDSRKLFRDDRDYWSALDLALEFVSKLEKDNISLVDKILPADCTAASKLYLPLEIAEALYFKNKYGVAGKFGPETEMFFDKVILSFLEEQELSYQGIRCKIGPRRPGYLSDKNVIWTTSMDCGVGELLNSDSDYRKFVERYLETFKNGENVEECAIRMKGLLGGN